MVPPHPRPNPPGPTLNAIARPAPDETDAEATARHLRTCRRLTELAERLAEAAAREAERNLEAPIEYPMPGTALPPLSRTADPGLLFARLCHAARQTMALEARLRSEARGDAHHAESHPPDRPSHTPTPHAPNPGAPTHQNTSFRTEPDESLHDEFAADHGRPAAQVIADIRKDLNLPPEKDLRKYKDFVAYPPPPPPSATKPNKPVRARPRPPD